MNMLTYTQASGQGRQFEWTLLHPPFSPDFVHLDYNPFGPMKKSLRGNIMSVTRKRKLQRWSGSENSQQNFTRQGYMLLFKRIAIERNSDYVKK